MAVAFDITSEEYILGQNILKYRKAKKLSQLQLADLVDIDRAAISRYENGTNGEMGFKTLKKFSVALGVSMDVLTGADDGLTEENRTYLEQTKELLLMKQKLSQAG